MTIDIRATATVRSESKTDRVRVRVRKPKQPRQPAEPKRFRKDRERPHGYVLISISVAPEHLARIDALADARKVSRSQLLVYAALASQLSPEEEKLIGIVRGMTKKEAA